MTIDRTFADRLQIYLNENPQDNVTAIARRAGLDASTVRQMLKGNKSQNPRFDTAIKIVKALGMTMEEFMGSKYDPIQAEIAQIYSQLSEQERRILLGAARGVRDVDEN